MKNKTASTIVGAALGGVACAGTLLAASRSVVAVAPVTVLTRLDPIAVETVPSAAPVVAPVQLVDTSESLRAVVVPTLVVTSIARPAPIPTRSPARPAPIIPLPR